MSNSVLIFIFIVVVNGQRSPCDKKRMDYFRCEKKIESDESLPTLCDKVITINIHHYISTYIMQNLIEVRGHITLKYILLFQIDAILARCFEVYRDCAEENLIEVSKKEYITELVDTPIDQPVWQELKKCKLIQVSLL